jgi:ubiquinone/menaquinone biosynthesis C-methylase UbiE
MPQVPSDAYDAVFSNYALEHVHDVAAAAREMQRVLRPGGVCAVTVSNPSAPEMLLARVTPLWLHRLVRGGEAWPVAYSFRSPEDLSGIFEEAGFRCREIHRCPVVGGYLTRFPALGPIGRWYDRLASRLGWRRLMGGACLVFDFD